MDDFFRGNWNQPSRPRYTPSFRGTPVQRKSSSSSSSRSPKVVTIPVHFVRSENTRSASALKIQKVFRAFLVRKSVRRIASIKREVDEIERKVSQRETIDLIRRDAKERLRVNETLMAQLLKLDSVRGVDSAVRDIRKAVIKKAIALQERVDAIVAGDQTLATDDQALEDEDEDSEAVDQTVGIKDSAECECDIIDRALETEGKPSDSRDSDIVSIENRTPEIEKSVSNSDDSANETNQTLEVEGEENVGVDSDCAAEGVDEMDVVTDIGVDSEVMVNDEGCNIKQMIVGSERDCGEESAKTSPTEECSLTPQSLIEGCEENISGRQEYEKKELEDVEKSEGDMKDCSVVGGRDDNKRNRELLEKMMEDNEKLTTLMTQLCERSETQTRMISSLTQRVEQLERAFICDKLRRKKKRHTA